MNKKSGKRFVNMKTSLSCLAAVAGTTLAHISHADTTLSVGGYIKLDAISSQYSDGDLPSGNIGRDFYLPSTIPVGGESESRDTDFHARSSRINFKTTSDIDGQKLVSFVEIDFMAGPEGNERVSNSYQPRLRHAFFTYDKWTFGQTWSTFQNVAVLPETLDFIGPSEGTVFIRQAQVRYTTGNWQFSVENPQTTLIPDANTSSIATDDGDLPDMVARYNATGDRISWSAAGIVRSLAYEDVATSVDANTIGFGVSLSASMKVGERNDVRVMATGGSGLGRYLALNLVNGAALSADGELEAIDAMGGMVSYRHFWTDKWRSNVSLGVFEADHGANPVNAGVTKSARSLHANLLHSPVKSVTVGVEVGVAQRELENGGSGSMNRIQFSAKHVF
jgi:hypothetical protein